MSSGLAVVAADAGGFRESINHGRDGVLVAPDDATGFAAEIVSLVMAPQRRAELRATARTNAIARDVTTENLDLLLHYAAAHEGLPVGLAPCAA
jgi:phosphatidylinositol alpha 1,6-mannosyltransferase